MKSQDVDAYLEELPAVRREALATVRDLIHRVAPDVQEEIRYKMPAFLVGGDVLCQLASQKRYLSLYVDPAVLEKHLGALAHLDVGKSCIRFRKIADLPLDEVEAILREVLAKRPR